MKISRLFTYAGQWLGIQKGQKIEEPALGHVDYLLQFKEYVSSYPIPQERRTARNQYSHANDPPIGGDITKPAITNCCYFSMGRPFISWGFPRFTGGENPFATFHPFTTSMEELMHRYGIRGSDIRIDRQTGQNELHAFTYKHAKAPFNPDHFYTETTVLPRDFEAGKALICFFVSTKVKNAQEFLNQLDKHMAGIGYPAGRYAREIHIRDTQLNGAWFPDGIADDEAFQRLYNPVPGKRITSSPSTK